MGLVDDIKYQFNKLDIAGKIIVINILIFILFPLVSFLLGHHENWIAQYLWLPGGFKEFILQPWSIITYGFLHTGFFHVLLNMLWLYFLARMFFNLFGTQQFLRVYFYSIFGGGLLFLLCYFTFPAFSKDFRPLVGASAGVYGLLTFLAAYNPDMSIRFFMFNLKLWWIAAALAIISLVSIPYDNAGGNIAHIGGMLIGYLMAQGTISIGSNNRSSSSFGESISDLFKTKKKSNLKTVYKKGTSFQNSDLSKTDKQRKIDTILEKIHEKGYDALTKEEKQFLFNAGK